MLDVDMCQDKWRFGNFKILTNSEDGVYTESKKLIIHLSGVKTPQDGYDNDGDVLWCWDLNLVPNVLPQIPSWSLC